MDGANAALIVAVGLLLLWLAVTGRLVCFGPTPAGTGVLDCMGNPDAAFRPALGSDGGLGSTLGGGFQPDSLLGRFGLRTEG